MDSAQRRRTCRNAGRSSRPRFDFGIDQAAQADAQSRKIGREQFGIAHQREVGFQLRLLLADVGRNGLASNFFLAFKDALHVDGQLAVVAAASATSSALTCIQSWPLSSTAPRA